MMVLSSIRYYSIKFIRNYNYQSTYKGTKQQRCNIIRLEQRWYPLSNWILRRICQNLVNQRKLRTNLRSTQRTDICSQMEQKWKLYSKRGQENFFVGLTETFLFIKLFKGTFSITISNFQASIVQLLFGIPKMELPNNNSHSILPQHLMLTGKRMILLLPALLTNASMFASSAANNQSNRFKGTQMK